MFFVAGVNDRSEDLEFSQMMTCNICGQLGRFSVFVTYTVLSLFLLPVWKWNRRYYVQTSCCNTIYELDPEIGKLIEQGEHVEIRSEDLTLIRRGRAGVTFRKCPICGYETQEDFEYCPKCGNPLV